MRFHLIIDIPDEDIQKASLNLEKTDDELVKDISNTCYLGMDCINAMLVRQYELEAGDWYVSSIVADDESIIAD